MSTIQGEKKAIFEPPKRNPPIHDMIRIWGRKPANVVRRYIESFTEEGDIVLDPFGGSGVCVIEALRLRRRAIYVDVNGFLKFVAETTCTPVNIDHLKEAFERLKRRIQNNYYEVIDTSKNERVRIKYNNLYSTRCPNCGQEAIIKSCLFSVQYRVVRYTIPEEFEGKLAEAGRKLLSILKKLGKDAVSHEWLSKTVGPKTLGLSRSEEITRMLNIMAEKYGCLAREGAVPIRIKYACPYCGRKGVKTPDDHDLELLQKINNWQPAYYYPNHELKYPTGKRFLTYRPGVERVSSLFTPRNLIALSILKYEIDRLENVPSDIRNTLYLTFASILYECSKMKREGAGAWGEKNYVVRPYFLEQNVMLVFERRFKKVLEGKKEAQRALSGFFNPTRDPKDVIEGRATVCFLQADTTNLCQLPDDSVDFIFADPPYGDSIQYYELSYMYSTWLQLQTEWEKEIIVNEKQGKDVNKYRDMLERAFRECFRVLKPGKYMVVTFHSRELKYWNTLMYAINVAGFEYIDAIYIPPPSSYTNWLRARYPGSMRGDIYIVFRKPEYETKSSDQTELEKERIIRNIILPEIRRTIIIHGGKASFDVIQRNVLLELLRRGLLHRKDIVNINLEEILNKYFEPVSE